MNKTTLQSRYCHVTESNGVREIVLNDSKTRNSLSLSMMEEILQALTKSWTDPNLRCIVLSSRGPVWSAGHDLKEFTSDRNARQWTDIFDKITEIISNIRKAPVPVIAKIDGIVAAGGVQLVASCDIVVCTEKSSFVISSANLGVFACLPAVALSRIMPHSKCLDMIMTGHSITAQDAYNLGLVSRLVPQGELNKELDNMIAAIKIKSREVLALGKEFFYKQLELPFEEANKLGTKKMLENLAFKVCQDGIRSFIEKRKNV